MSEDSWLTTHLSLLLRVQDPENEAAWEEFVTKYRQPVVQYCCKRFHVTRDEAEDVAQTVLIKLLKEMKRFEYDATKSFRSWLKTVTKNTLLTHFRKEQRRIDKGASNSNVHQMIENFADERASDELATTLSHELQRDLFEEAEGLVSQRVDEQTWNAYRQRCEGTKAKEIAVELGMKVAAVHKAKSRVVRMIREEIAMMLNDTKSI